MLSGSKDEPFRTQIEPHRRAITAHCYRMLGSLQDAEEVAQESLLRGWQRLDELRSSDASKAWLYRIATNACLDRLKQRRRRVQSHQVAPQADPERPMGPPVHEYLWIEPAPDALLEIPADAGLQPDTRASMHESISLAFITALQLLPAKQRAALLLVDVLGREEVRVPAGRGVDHVHRRVPVGRGERANRHLDHDGTVTRETRA